jgi:hypothetical protein
MTPCLRCGRRGGSLSRRGWGTERGRLACPDLPRLHLGLAPSCPSAETGRRPRGLGEVLVTTWPRLYLLRRGGCGVGGVARSAQGSAVFALGFGGPKSRCAAVALSGPVAAQRFSSPGKRGESLPSDFLSLPSQVRSHPSRSAIEKPRGRTRNLRGERLPSEILELGTRGRRRGTGSAELGSAGAEPGKRFALLGPPPPREPEPLPGRWGLMAIFCSVMARFPSMRTAKISGSTCGKSWKSWA